MSHNRYVLGQIFLFVDNRAVFFYDTIDGMRERNSVYLCKMILK